MSATSLGPPTQGGGSFPRRVMVMKSRGVGLPVAEHGDDLIRCDCVPVKRASSASVNGSSSGFDPKSKLLFSDSSISGVDLERQALDQRELVLGLRLGRGHHRVTERGDLHVLGIAAKPRGVAP